MVGGNIEERHKDCPGYPLWIGYKNSIHYQSLLPTDSEVLYPRSCRQKNKEETKEVFSAQENQSKEKKTKALVDNPIKKITQKNKKPGEEMTVNVDQEDIEPLVSNQKRKSSEEQNCSPKKSKVIEQEAFVFEDEEKVYRCVSESEGYQCPMCPKVFGQLGRHISSSKCGENIDIKRFTAELKKIFES